MTIFCRFSPTGFIAIGVTVIRIMLSWSFFICALNVYGILVTASLYANITQTLNIEQRQKRGLIFEGGGTIKLIVGPIFPLDFGDAISWRSLLALYNIQGGHYNLPTTPLYAWDKWENTYARTMQQMHTNFNKTNVHAQDDSRVFVYAILKSLMSRNSVDGQTCLLRLICENAQINEHVGLFSEIFNIILTPRNTEPEAIYYQAYAVGEAGVNCIKKYKNCRKGSNIFDAYLDTF